MYPLVVATLLRMLYQYIDFSKCFIFFFGSRVAFSANIFIFCIDQTKEFYCFFLYKNAYDLLEFQSIVLLNL